MAKANDKRRIAALAEEIDAHRKRQQTAHPGLSLTGMYNVLEKLRADEALNAKEKAINDQGLIATLKNLHDQLDAAVLAAYGWEDLAPAFARGPLDEATRQTLLARLAALNVERAREESEGTVRWLRPEYQAPAETRPKEKATTQGKQAAFAIGGEDEAPAVDGARHPWPAQLAEQVRAVADLLAASDKSLTEDEIAARFSGKGPWKKRLPQIVETLVALGRARRQSTRIIAV